MKKLSIAQIPQMIMERNPSLITIKYTSSFNYTYLEFDNKIVWSGHALYGNGKYELGREVYTKLVQFFTNNCTIIEKNDNQSIFSITS